MSGWGDVEVFEAAGDEEWREALALLVEVYAGEGYTRRELVEANATRERISAAGTLLITRDHAGRVSGATVLLVADGPMRQMAREGEREFRLLAVRGSARGSGVGAALVNECIRRAERAKAKALVLWTQPSMHAAQRLYERLGFVRDPSRDVPDDRGWMRLVYVRAIGLNAAP